MKKAIADIDKGILIVVGSYPWALADRSSGLWPHLRARHYSEMLRGFDAAYPSVNKSINISEIIF